MKNSHKNNYQFGKNHQLSSILPKLNINPKWFNLYPFDVVYGINWCHWYLIDLNLTEPYFKCHISRAAHSWRENICQRLNSLPDPSSLPWTKAKIITYIIKFNNRDSRFRRRFLIPIILFICVHVQRILISCIKTGANPSLGQCVGFY
jgi:hypothetical protein